MRYAFIKEQQKTYPLTMLCRVMKVRRSCFYQWAKPEAVDPKKEQVEQEVLSVFRDHKRRYGVRRVLSELQDRGISVGRYKCRSLFKKHGLKAIQPRSYVPKTTQSRHR